MVVPVAALGVRYRRRYLFAMSYRRDEVDGQDGANLAQSTLTRGAMEASDSGTVLLGEIATTPWPGISPPSDKQVEIVAFAEVLGLNQARASERLLAAEKHHIDLANSWMIGDADRDILMAQRAGVGKTLRIITDKAVGIDADVERWIETRVT